MSSDRSLIERQIERVEVRPFTLDGFHRRRQRRERNRRIGTAVVTLLVAGATIGGLLRAFSSGTVPANDPRGPFLGIWVNADPDGSTQTMTIGASGDGVEMVMHDDFATVCSGAPATMTGSGRLEGADALVIPSPVLTCDDGSEPQALSGPPLEEQLRNMTFVHDAEADILTDNFELVWERVSGEDPNPDQATPLWPQSSLEEVREAQELADAGDPRYTWQVDPELERNLNLDDGGPEIFARFLREELGWEEFRSGPFLVNERRWEEFPRLVYEVPDPDNPETFTGVVYIRCAPGRTNPLYPDDPYGGECAPTIDEFRYETVQIDVARLASHGPSGIWVVTRSVPGPDAVQAVPPSDSEVAAMLEPFLQARVDGEGAEEYLPSREAADLPLLYATTSGAPYERFEYELVEGPVWPSGWMEFEVRLFAEGGETVVERSFVLDRVGVDGPLELAPSYRASDPVTTENGEAVALPYEFLDGEVTFAAAPSWRYSPFDNSEGLDTLISYSDEESLTVVADPLPVESGCQQGPAAADAEALARTLLSDPDLVATEPVSVSVAGIDAIRMEVVTAAGASVCETFGLPQVVTPNDHGWPGVGLEGEHRMRLYLLDLPEGSSARILAIAISAPEARFDSVLEEVAPILDSFEFHAP